MQLKCLEHTLVYEEVKGMEHTLVYEEVYLFSGGIIECLAQALDCTVFGRWQIFYFVLFKSLTRQCSPFPIYT